LRIAVDLDYKALIVEGDSQILIVGLRKIINGTHPERVLMNWRLLYGFSEIANSIRGSSTIISKHVRRKENVVARLPCERGSFKIPRESKWSWREVGPGTFWDMVTQLASCDTFIPDGVTTGEVDGLDYEGASCPHDILNVSSLHLVLGGQYSASV
jgi:hypothetical protein